MKIKLRKNKKGVLDYTLVKVVKIALITFVLVFLIFGIFVKYFDSKADIEKCRLSFIAAAQTKLLGDSKIQFKCDRVELEVSNKDVVDKGELQKSKVMRLIAEEMRNCYYKTNEGGSNPFEQNIALNSKPCFFCSHIKFDSKLNEFDMIEEDLFLQYLNTKMEKSNMSYFKYIAGMNEKSLISVTNVSFDKDYYVLYTLSQSGWIFDPSSLVGKPASFIDFRDKTDSGIFWSKIMLVEMDKVDQLGCNYIAN